VLAEAKGRSPERSRRNKHMKFIQIKQGKKSKHVVNTPGEYIFFIHNYSGEVDIEIKSQEAKVFIYGIYVGKKGDNFTLNTIQHHKIGNSISDLLIKGVFFDDAKFIYDGLIKIDKKAQKSNAYQKNQNLMLSKDVFVSSKPNLEILANDVRCTHGSTTGQLDQTQVYYLKTRGLTEDTAQKLLIEGFVGDVFNKMEENGVDDPVILERIRQSTT